MPVLNGDTWRDIAVLALEREGALEECTLRMRAIRSDDNKDLKR